jgi:hypothetical protein
LEQKARCATSGGFACRNRNLKTLVVVMVVVVVIYLLKVHVSEQL